MNLLPTVAFRLVTVIILMTSPAMYARSRQCCGCRQRRTWCARSQTACTGSGGAGPVPCSASRRPCACRLGSLHHAVWSTQRRAGFASRRQTGECQGSCRPSYAAFFFLFSSFAASCTMLSRSGLRVTGPIADQSRVHDDQRAGWRSRAAA